ncbi:ABC transporter substrate-binding protein [Microvirga sp. VF16]|uniref:ABC transporter substrate-binding protein n=1 Tax=Microvirga sp. VF16 TaxID=2807101 RepID=UPI00193D96EF|nr:ABC transporter substrate-binding protein [Microvirga sp. VF16]QRM32376.1 ABC transporter substrate-binding protein [Microvirga sp. VF16]
MTSLNLKGAGRALVAGALLGSLGAGPGHAEDVKLEVAFAVPHHRQMYDESTPLFETAHPGIKLRFLTPAVDYDALAQDTLRQSIAGSLPDVMFHGYARVKLMAERGLAVPLDDMLAADGGPEALGYAPASLDACRYQGKLYGIPFTTSMPIVYFNADLVRKAGSDPDHLPSDWAGILELGRKIDGLDGPIQGAVFDYKGNGNWSFLALLSSLGTEPMNAQETRLNFDNAQTLRALQIIHDFGRSGQVDMTRNQWRQAYASGTLGIFVNTSSILTEYQKQIGDRLEIRTMPFPLESKDGRVPVGGACVMMFAKAPAHQRAAWNYLKFMTGPVAQTIVVKFTGYMPNNLKALEDPTLLGEYYRDNPLQLTAVKQLPVATAWYSFPGDNGVRISKEIEEVLNRLGTLKITPAQAQQELIDRVSPLLPH